MPNIREFSAPQGLDLRPTETGVESFAGAGRRIGGFYNQVADAYNTVAGLKNDEGSRIAGAVKDVGQVAVDYEDHREISAGATAFSQMQAGLTQQWLDTAKKADPNDPSVAAKFQEEVVAPALDQFRSGFNTENSQKFAEQKSQSLQQHFSEMTASTMSQLAGVAVKNNIANSTTAMSNTAITDPTSVPNLLAGVDHSIGAMVDSSPTLSPVDAARAKADLSQSAKAAIVKSGAIGAIQKSGNPEATADAWIKQYPDYINGDEAKMLAGNARQQIRARNYDFETNRRRDKEIAQDKSNDARDKYISDIYSNDPRLANDPTAHKIVNDPSLLPTAKANLLALQARELKPETDSRISQQTFVGLLRDLRKPNSDPDDVLQKAWDARIADPGQPNSLTEKDFNQFRAEVVARKTPEGAALQQDRAAFFKNYATAITGNRAYDPSVGDPKMYNAEMDSRRMENMLHNKGLDPHLAYDPASEYFLGKPERTAKWAASMQQDLQTRASFNDRFGNLPPAQQAAPKAPPPPKVGDTKDGYQYLGGSPGAAASWKKVQ